MEKGAAERWSPGVLACTLELDVVLDKREIRRAR